MRYKVTPAMDWEGRSIGVLVFGDDGKAAAFESSSKRASQLFQDSIASGETIEIVMARYRNFRFEAEGADDEPADD